LSFNLETERERERERERFSGHERERFLGVIHEEEREENLF